MNTPTYTGRIFLYLAPCGTWHADMSSATDARHINDLMGTTQIPIPFTRGADWRAVQRQIAMLNPSDEVVVDILSR